MLLIYVPSLTPRMIYVFKLIFEQHLGIKYATTTDNKEFVDYAHEKLNYSHRRFGDEFFVYADNLLTENFIKKIDVSVNERHYIKVIFPDTVSEIGFDIFSAVFYMVSRYEEYLPFDPDRFGRFKAIDSMAYKNNFLHLPVADKWIQLLKDGLQKKYPDIKYKSNKFQCILTYDIDVAYKYKGRSVKRNVGATLKDIIRFDFKNIYCRIQTLFFNKKDPWDVYDYLCNIIEQHNFSSVFFFLMGDNSSLDRNLDYKKIILKSLINFVKTFSSIGIHPSFRTTVNSKKIEEEKQRLEKISQIKIYKSRQHYLKFLLPETYQALIQSGITEDYSMCFPEIPGFRAGTSKPFYFYDLKNETTTNLMIYPATFMDGSFIYSSKTNKIAVKEIDNLIDEILSVDGTFISIWHNHTVSETKDFLNWKKIHDAIIEKLIPLLS